MNRGSHSNGAFTNPVLVGASIVIAVVLAVFLSYNANRGLPFVRTYKLTASVPDAAELVVGSEVRIGGFRVGQVNGIEAVPPTRKRPPYARLRMDLDGTIRGIPADTLVRVRPRSLLGAKYVELEPGTGRDLPSGTTLPPANARATPELDETFNVFDAETRRGLQGTIRSFGDATAGRGPDLNRSAVALRRVLGPLQRVSETLAAPRTDLAGLVDGVARFSGALAPAATDLVALFDRGASTLRAVDAAGPALERALAGLPETFGLGTTALRAATPVLGDATRLAVALRDGTGRLSQTTDRVTGALRAGTVTLRRTAELTRPLDDTLAQLDAITSDPRAPTALDALTETVRLLQPTVGDLYAAQLTCNVAGIFARNTSGAVSRGDRLGTWMAFVPILRPEQQQHSATQDPDLHVDTVPRLDETECEAGNEPYAPGKAIGSPAGRQPAATEETRPPADVTRRARAAGLLEAPRAWTGGRR